MEFGTPEPLEPDYKPDIAYPVTFAETGETYPFMERWDRAVRWRRLAAFCVKIFDDEEGLVEGWMDEENFNKLVEHTGAEPHDKETMTKAEYLAWQKSLGNE